MLVGVFIDPTAWADLNGVEYRIPYEELRESDFWQFFHLSESAREAVDESRTRVQLQPGGFADKLDLELEVDDSGRVRQAQLALDRDWVTDPATGLNPFALDIAASFVRTLTPPPDRPTLAPFAPDIRMHLSDRASFDAFVGEHPEVGQLLGVYAGAAEQATLILDFARLDARNRPPEEGGRLEIVLHEL